MSAFDVLSSHPGLLKRRSYSESKLQQLRQSLAELLQSHSGIAVFAAGSLGRYEAGPRSDLDLFVIADIAEELTPLQVTRLLAGVADVNDKLGFPPFSGDMRFFKLYRAEELIEHTGKPIDDTENSFTARMLLLLEGRCVAGNDVYTRVLNKVCENYFRDNKGKKDFKPLFLLNDVLRYWRTLCLNYEGARSDATKPWRKKNLNLRFSRLSTVFSTVTALMALKPSTASDFFPLALETPFERLASAIDQAGLDHEGQLFRSFLDNYEWFLQLKDDKGAETLLSDDDLKIEAKRRAEVVAEFFDQLLHSPQLRDSARYLTL